jgi:hypothetical protein
MPIVLDNTHLVDDGTGTAILFGISFIAEAILLVGIVGLSAAGFIMRQHSNCVQLGF